MQIPKLIDTDRYNALVKARYGYVLFNKNDLYIGRAIEKYGEFSEGEYLRHENRVSPMAPSSGVHMLLLQ